jgi:hypothetical protein
MAGSRPSYIHPLVLHSSNVCSKAGYTLKGATRKIHVDPLTKEKIETNSVIMKHSNPDEPLVIHRMIKEHYTPIKGHIKHYLNNNSQVSLKIKPIQDDGHEIHLHSIRIIK